MGGHFGKGAILIMNEVTVGSLKNISGPSINSDTIDVTTHDSEGRFKEFISGLADPGELTLEGNFTNAEDANDAFLDPLASGEVVEGSLNFNADGFGATWSFEGMITRYETTNPSDGVVGFSATVKITSVPVLTDNLS
jgi:predicted secreted protein